MSLIEQDRPAAAGYASQVEALGELDRARGRRKPRVSDGHWLSSARCAALAESGVVDEGWWFPARGDEADRAKSVCAACPVRVDCLLASLDVAGSDGGIWGGGGDRLRRVLRRTNRVHDGFESGCACAFCVEVAAHLERLDAGGSSWARRGRAPAQRSFGPGVAHGNPATYSAGCRCSGCREAQMVRQRARRDRAERERSAFALFVAWWCAFAVDVAGERGAA